MGTQAEVFTMKEDKTHSGSIITLHSNHVGNEGGSQLYKVKKLKILSSCGHLRPNLETWAREMARSPKS